MEACPHLAPLPSLPFALLSIKVNFTGPETKKRFVLHKVYFSSGEGEGVGKDKADASRELIWICYGRSTRISKPIQKQKSQESRSQ